MSKVLGLPCWYELSTAKGQLAAAGRFYGTVMGWSVANSGMEGFDYHLASVDGAMVAGLMEMPPEAAGMPPMWMIYFATPDGEATLREIEAAGGTISRPLSEIPGTGRFAIAGDPQGVVFGILEPAPMETPPAAGAFDPQRVGHGAWAELMVPDIDAALTFYGRVFGWTTGRSMPMGQDGRHQLFEHDGTEIGGMMGAGNAPAAGWNCYFATGSVGETVQRATAAGGSVVHEPSGIPGGSQIATLSDPQGAHFSVVGPR